MEEEAHVPSFTPLFIKEHEEEKRESWLPKWTSGMFKSLNKRVIREVGNRQSKALLPKAGRCARGCGIPKV